MFLKLIMSFILIVFTMISSYAQMNFHKDTISTSAGDLVITFIGHGSLMFTFNGIVIHDDPFGRLADYSALPDANIVLVTHHHPDHFDTTAIASVSTDSTKIFLTKTCAANFKAGTIMNNGDVQTVDGIKIEAVPAYNIVSMRDDGQPFHVKGECNGYVLTFGDKRIYIAGDTENTPEMKALKDIDIAFLPMNLPYTMTTEMVADAAAAFKPKILYPYHTGETDVTKLVDLMKDVKDVELRILPMK